MGNLESDSDNLDEAVEYFNKAITIQIDRGDEAATLLAISYLCLARAYYRMKNYTTAFSILRQSESLFFRTVGADAAFMAQYVLCLVTFLHIANNKSVHFLYGNIDLAQNNIMTASRSYQTALKISLANTPIHPITAAVYYKLGCVEFRRGNVDLARYESRIL